VIAAVAAAQLGYVLLWSSWSRRVGAALSLAVIAGAASALAVAPLNIYVEGIVGHGTLAVFFAPVFEECMKYGSLVLVVTALGKELRGASEVSYPHAGMIAGTVFMLLERFTDATAGSLGLTLTSLEEIPVHPVTTGLASLSIVGGRPTRRVAILLPVAIALHAAFNFSLQSSSLTQLPYVWTVALEGFWVAFLLMGFVFRRANPFRRRKGVGSPGGGAPPYVDAKEVGPMTGRSA
jgi:hypothetical protein